MDHMSLTTVVSAAKEFLSKETALHGLVNNAGIMAVPHEMTGDGFDIQWQTNYIAHWVFTSHLLPTMLSTSKISPPGSVRIVNVSSGGHMMAPKQGINFADTSLSADTAIIRYGQSKLANILHARSLHKRYGPGSENSKAKEGEIWTSSIQPGVVQTNLDGNASQMPTFMRGATFVINALGGRWPADKGSWTNVFCVASPDMTADQSGICFERIAKPSGMLQSAHSKDMELAERLEEWTKKEMTKGGWI